MKVYIISYVDWSHGQMESFTNKAQAVKRFNEILRDKVNIDQYPEEIDEKYFPISEKGILDAINYGARMVNH